ncbi:conjugal transfer protein TrbI [Burkholderia sp. HI2500]|nr:conjugal transfer protein TrbI [Burkholderia sp. HI2500]
MPPTGMDPRGIPGLQRGKRNTSVRGVGIIFVIVVIVIVIAVSVAVFAKRFGDAYLEHKRAKRDAPVQTAVVDPDFQGNKDHVEAVQAASAAEAASAASAGLPEPSGARGSQPAGNGVAAAGTATTTGTSAGAPVPAPAPGDPRLAGDVLVKFGKSDDGLPTLAQASNGGQNQPTRQYARDGLDDSLTPSRLAPVKASFLPNLSLLLKRGAMLPCGQFTDIVSTHPGMATCHLSEDVYSADGKTLLLERGSEATGEQRKAVLEGQASIFVVWTRIDTPSGVTVDLDSPATNALGATGIDADVDTHFWLRFRGALMLSVISDAGQALANLAQSGNGNRIQFSNTTSQSQQLAADTLKSTINIPPTATSRHGSTVNIFVARDVDFGSVYELVKR